MRSRRVTIIRSKAGTRTIAREGAITTFSCGTMFYAVISENRIVRSGRFSGADEARVELKPVQGELLFLQVGSMQ